MSTHHVIVITCPKAFRDGPQFDENGKLDPTSWPTPFTTSGLKSWVSHGDEVGGRVMVNAVIDDANINEWISTLPAGWLDAGRHEHDGHSQHVYDETGELISSGLTVHTVTDQAEYTKHMTPPETGTTVYKRVIKIFGWPPILD